MPRPPKLPGRRSQSPVNTLHSTTNKRPPLQIQTTPHSQSQLQPHSSSSPSSSLPPPPPPPPKSKTSKQSTSSTLSSKKSSIPFLHSSSSSSSTTATTTTKRKRFPFSSNTDKNRSSIIPSAMSEPLFESDLASLRHNSLPTGLIATTSATQLQMINNTTEEEGGKQVGGSSPPTPYPAKKYNDGNGDGITSRIKRKSSLIRQAGNGGEVLEASLVNGMVQLNGESVRKDGKVVDTSPSASIASAPIPREAGSEMISANELHYAKTSNSGVPFDENYGSTTMVSGTSELTDVTNGNGETNGAEFRKDIGFGELRGPAKVRVKRGVRERTRGLFAGLRRDSNASEMGRRRIPVLGGGPGGKGLGGLSVGDGSSVGGGNSSLGGSVDGVVDGGRGNSGGGNGGGVGMDGGRRKKGSTLSKSGGGSSIVGGPDGGGSTGVHYGSSHHHHHIHNRHVRNKAKQDLKKREKHLQRREKINKKKNHSSSLSSSNDRNELHRIDGAGYASPWQATEQLAAEVRELRAKIEEVRMNNVVTTNGIDSANHIEPRRILPTADSVPSSSVPTSPRAPVRRRSAEDHAALNASSAHMSPRRRGTAEAGTLAGRPSSSSASSATRTQSMAASLTLTTSVALASGEDREQKSSDGDLAATREVGKPLRIPRDRSHRNIDMEMLRLRFEAEGGSISKDHVIQLILDMRAERENNRELREIVASQRAKLGSISRSRDELEAERDVLNDRVRELETRRSEEETLRSRVKVLERENERLRKQVDSDKKLRRSKGRNVEVVVESLKAELAASKARLHAEVAEGERLRKRLSMYEGSNGDLQLD